MNHSLEILSCKFLHFQPKSVTLSIIIYYYSRYPEKIPGCHPTPGIGAYPGEGFWNPLLEFQIFANLFPTPPPPCKKAWYAFEVEIDLLCLKWPLILLKYLLFSKSSFHGNKTMRGWRLVTTLLRRLWLILSPKHLAMKLHKISTASCNAQQCTAMSSDPQDT